MDFEVKTITPAEAAAMLKAGNSRNRPIRKQHVMRLAEEMRERKWVLNGVPIIFNGKLLIDGQHRLEACVESGKPFETLIVRNVAPDSFATIDTGKKRSLADTLAVKGYENYTALAASASIVHQYQIQEFNDEMGVRQGRTNRVVLEAMKTYVALPESVAYCTPYKTKIIPISIMGACHYIFSKIDHIQADDFIKRAATGDGVKIGTPMYELRNRLVDNYASPRKHSRGYIMSLVIKTWNAERQGRELKLLRGWTSTSGEQFPTAL